MSSGTEATAAGVSAKSGGPSTSTTSTTSARWSPHQRWTLAVVSMASFMMGLDALVVATALPSIHADLHASASALAWTVAAYALAFAAVVLAGAVLGDRVGRRAVFLAGLAVFTAGSAACAASPDASVLIAARAFQGVGGGIAVPLALVLISEAFPPERRARAIGIWGAIFGLAVGVGPLVGGAIVAGLAWQWVFWVNVPIGVAVFACGATRLSETRGTPRPLDVLGLVLAAGAVFAFTDALLHGPTTGWGSTLVLALFTAAVVFAGALLVWERHTAHPMLPAGTFANASFRGACAARGALAAALFGGVFLIPQFLQLERHYSPIVVGLALLPWTGLTIFIAPLAGRWAGRVGERLPVCAGLACLAAALALIAWVVGPTSSYAALAVPLLLAGVGSALAFPTTASASMRSVAPQHFGVASGVSSTAQQLGGVLGVSVATAIFASAGGYATPAAFVSGLRPALFALAALAALGALAATKVRIGIAVIPASASGVS